MAANGRPTFLSGTAPDIAAGNYATVQVNRTVQQFHIRNAALAGGSNLRFGVLPGATSTMVLLPGESFSLNDIRLDKIVVGSDTAGATCPYNIVTVEQ